MPIKRPHRESKLRTCAVCGCFLSSANKDRLCFAHGGFRREKEDEQNFRSRAEDFVSLMELETA